MLFKVHLGPYTIPLREILPILTVKESEKEG